AFAERNGVEEVYVYLINSSRSVNLDDPQAETTLWKLLQECYPDCTLDCLKIDSVDAYCNYFYQTEHHWNYKGSYEGYKAIIRMMLGEDEPLMQAVLSGTIDDRARMEFLAPLDPVLWDKALIEALWDFRYSWEIYTPAAQRKYGYYTLPILFGDRFVGRVDSAVDRREGVLRVQGLWWEPGVRVTKKLETALERTLQRFAKFNGCESVTGPESI
ncbi:MAG: winged helix DNA-binding domain-containing protein, partial [Lachnospiraceae bacterium]|nr:winged helix DNA-binding domain-containing protein [Lachnospiraceae bacterium]